MTVHLRTVTRTQGNNAALKDGTIRPAAADLDFDEVPVLVHAFRRMVRELAYDVCEMALTTYLCAREHGVRFTALPIFLVRGLHHDKIVRHAGSDVADPRDLEGRRVGVHRGWTVTTGVWARGILRDEHDVDLDRVTWVRSGDEHVAAYVPPANVVPVDGDRDLAHLLRAGDLAAAVNIPTDDPDLVPLIPEPTTAALTALHDRGLYPINHVVVVRDDLLEAHPALAGSLFTAFAAAKERYVAALRADAIATPTATDRLYRQVMETVGGDPLPYGIAPNHAMLDTLIGHAVDQRILPRSVAVESLFAAGTHDLTA